MQKLDPLTLTAILDAMVLKPFSGLKSAARDLNVAASTAFRWQAESARHEKEQRASSEYLIEWMGNRSWYHRHVALARRLSILRLDQRLREDAVVPRREYLFRQGGEPIWQVDPQLAADALDPSMWELNHGGRDIKDVYKRGLQRRAAAGVQGSAAQSAAPHQGACRRCCPKSMAKPSSMK